MNVKKTYNMVDVVRQSEHMTVMSCGNYDGIVYFDNGGWRVLVTSNPVSNDNTYGNREVAERFLTDRLKEIGNL